MQRFRKIATVVSSAALALGGLLGGAGSASATVQPQGGCTLGACSQTTNQTSHLIYAAKDWCDANHGPCAHKPKHKDRMYLHGGQSTPGGHDWDAFHVPGGCTLSGIKHAAGGGFTIHGGKAGKWVQVHNYEHYYIKKAAC